MDFQRYQRPWRVTREPSAFRVSDDTGQILALTPFVPVGQAEPGLSEEDAFALAEMIASIPDLIAQMHLANLAREDEGGH